MNRIVTANQALEINGILFQRGDFIATPMSNGMRLTHKHTGNVINLLDGQLEMDGETATSEQVFDYLKENGFLNDGGASGEGLDKATVQQIQEGTNNENYITPYLMHMFVEWFSSELLIIDESYTESPTSAQVNEKYPDARVRTMLYLPNAGSGMKYTKLNETDWESMPYTVA